MSSNHMQDASPPPYVGYGTPPKHTQFKTGKSGNPKGRPRQKYLVEILEEVLNEPINVNIGGEKKTMSKKEAILQKLMVDSVNGKSSAVKNLIELLRSLTKMHPM